MFVGPTAGHATHHLQRVFHRRTAMLARSWLAHPQFGVLAASPMDREDDFARFMIDIGDNVGNQSSQQLLTGAHADFGSVPRRRQLTCQVGKGIRSYLDSLGLFGELACFHLLDALQGLLPAFLKLCRNKTIVGIAGRITALREACLITGLFKLQSQNTVPVFLLFSMHSLCLERCFNRHRLHHSQQLLGNCGIDPRAAEGHAPRLPHDVSILAAIHRPALRVAGINDTETFSASAAAHHP